MKTRTSFGLAATLLAATALPLHGDDGPKVAADFDIVYSKAGDAELKLDVARPSEGDGPFPGVIVLYGGAWRTGKKDHMRGAIGEFARRGYVAVAPQYRHCPKDVFPAQVHDVKAAVRWLRAHAKDYHLDTEHVGAIGFSAGAHLALMLGVTGPDDGLEGPTTDTATSTKVQAVVNYFGPIDLAAKDLPDVSKPLLRDFLGGTQEEKPEAAVKASPLTFVTSDDAPTLTFQGTKDNLIPYNQAIKLTDKLTAVGVPGRVELLIGVGHGWQGAELERTKAETFAFFDHYLKARP